MARGQYGIGLEITGGMKTQVSTMTTDTQAPQRLLAWTFRRGGRFLTCEVLCTSDKRYAVIVIPHWSGGTTLVEQLANSVDAFQRHAAGDAVASAGLGRRGLCAAAVTTHTGSAGVPASRVGPNRRQERGSPCPHLASSGPRVLTRRPAPMRMASARSPRPHLRPDSRRRRFPP